MSSSAERFPSDTFYTSATLRHLLSQQDSVLNRAFIVILFVSSLRASKIFADEAFIRLLHVDTVRELTPGHNVVFENLIQAEEGIETDELSTQVLSVDTIRELTPGHNVVFENRIQAEQGIQTNELSTQVLFVDTIRELTPGHNVVVESKVDLLRNNATFAFFTAGEELQAGEAVSVYNDLLYTGFSQPDNITVTSNPNQMADHNRIIWMTDNAFLITGVEIPKDRAVQTGYVQVVRWRPDLQTIEIGGPEATPPPGPGTKVRLPTANTGTAAIPFRITDALAIARINDEFFAVAYVDMSGAGAGSVANQPRVIFGRLTAQGTAPGYNITFNTITAESTTGNGNLNGATNTAIPNAYQIRLRLIDVVGTTVRLLATWRNNTSTTIQWAVVRYDLATFPAAPLIAEITSPPASRPVNSGNMVGNIDTQVLNTSGDFVTVYTNPGVIAEPGPFTPQSFVAVSGSVAGIAITLGAEQTLEFAGQVVQATSIEYISSTVIPGTTRVILFYTDTFRRSQNAAMVIQVNTVTDTVAVVSNAGSPAYWYTGSAPSADTYQVIPLSATRFLVTFMEAGASGFLMFMVVDFNSSTGQFVFYPWTAATASDTQSGATAQHPLTGEFFTVYREPIFTYARLQRLIGLTTTAAGQVVVAHNYQRGLRPIGIVQQNATAGQTNVPVVITGVSTVHSGLVTGQDYYMHGIGAIRQQAEMIEIGSGVTVRSGVALSSTNLFVNRTG